MEETLATSRKRKCSEGEQSGVADRLEGKSYFDTIPEEAIENIIRFTSNRPRHPHWLAYVQPQVALNLLKSESVLSRSSRILFRSVHMRPYVEANLYPHSREAPKSTLVVGYLQPVLPELRETLVELEVKWETFPVSVKRSVLVPCHGLRRLSLDLGYQRSQFLLYQILFVHCANLEFLEVRKNCLFEEDVLAIAEFGKGLKGFKLSARRAAAPVKHIWESLGETLEEVSLPGTDFRTSWNIPSIMHSCKRLRKISVQDIFSEHHDELESLCTALSEQLESLTLFCCGISPPRLGRIAAACTNVSIDLTEVLGCSLSALCAMRTRARFANIGVKSIEDFEHVPMSVVRVAEVCGNLVGIHFQGAIPEAFFRQFFSQPKLSLVEFTGQFEKTINSGFVLEVLGSKISNLKKFDFHGSLPSMPIWEDFVAANPLLSSVIVIDMQPRCFCVWKSSKGSRSEKGAALNLGAVAEIFLQCQQLKVLSLCCIKSIKVCNAGWNEDYSRACLHARHRNIAVTICAYPYL